VKKQTNILNALHLIIRLRLRKGYDSLIYFAIVFLICAFCGLWLANRRSKAGGEGLSPGRTKHAKLTCLNHIYGPEWWTKKSLYNVYRNKKSEQIS